MTCDFIPCLAMSHKSKNPWWLEAIAAPGLPEIVIGKALRFHLAKAVPVIALVYRLRKPTSR
jgi:hypothetical protein